MSCLFTYFIVVYDTVSESFAHQDYLFEPNEGRDCFPLIPEMLVALIAARSRLV